MKKLLIIALTLSMTLFAATAFAERGHGGNGYYASKGDRIEHRFEHKADRAERHGNYAKADRLRHQGEHINRHLDRKWDRIRAYHDRNDHRYCNVRDHRHYYPPPRVVYRDYHPHDTYFSLVINQPGLWLGWGFYD